jgi:hypothetical protein
MRENRNAYKMFVGKPKGIETSWKTKTVDGMMIIKWSLRKEIQVRGLF